MLFLFFFCLDPVIIYLALTLGRNELRPASLHHLIFPAEHGILSIIRTFVHYSLDKLREDGTKVDTNNRQQRRRQGAAPQARVHQEVAPVEDEYDDVWPMPMPPSARRYQGLADVKTEVGRTPADALPLTSRSARMAPPYRQTTIPPRRSATQGQIPATHVPRERPDVQAVDTDIYPSPRSSGVGTQQKSKRRHRLHWLLFVGLAMLTMMLGWVLLSMLSNWWDTTQNDWHYGRPRTFQTDAVVKHNDSAVSPSHFIALNLNRHIEIIEFPGGDASKAKIYIGPTLVGQGQDLAPVTLSFKDVNGDGKVDMVVNIQDSRFVFINENGAFRPAHPGEVTQP